MNFLAFLGSLLGSFFKALFCRSNDERLGASEEKAAVLEKQLKISEAMREAPKATTRDELVDVLKRGKLAIALVLVLAACSSVPAVVCPKVKPWSSKEQAQMVVDQVLLPEGSPIISALVDYYNMRNEARACQEANGEQKNGGSSGR